MFCISMITPSNKTKTAISPVNKNIGSFYLLTEDGDFLTQEDGGIIMLDMLSYSVTGINQVKTPFGTTTIQAGSPMGLLLTLTYPSTFTVGSGVINQVKS